MSCVLTLALDEASQERFEELRQRFFPPALNRIPAHLSLFHSLREEDATLDALQAAAKGQAGFTMQVAEVRSMGKGVMYAMQSAEAKALHRRLSEAFDDQLSAQDRQGFRPHVVVQNKVTPEEAKKTLALLQTGFRAFSVTSVGLDLWRYLGGPWHHLRRFAFQPHLGEI